jgi:hypothetical protein
MQREHGSSDDGDAERGSHVGDADKDLIKGTRIADLALIKQDADPHGITNGTRISRILTESQTGR